MPIFSTLLAQTPVPDIGNIDPCPTGLSCFGDLDAYARATVIPAALYALSGILFGMLVLYAFRILFESDNDSAKTEGKQAYGHAIFGTILILFASVVSWAFTTLDGVDTAPLASTVDVVVTILKGLLSTVLVLNIFVQGVRLIIAQDDGQREKAKKQFFIGLVATAVVVLASPIVNTFWIPSIGIATTQAIGIANFLGTIFGAAAVIGIIMSGIFLIISVDESLKERAKKILLASIIALIVVICSYALVTLFIFF